MQLNLDQSLPIYKQIIDDIKRQLARGDLSPGDRMPSQRQLAERLRVNPNTIQRAYREMESVGLVETMRGRGTFICRDPDMVTRIRHEMAREALTTFVAEMRALGFELHEMTALVKREVQRE